jgi:AraC-like DNA-binding protein
MTNNPSIAQLQSDWFKFSDLDRATAVLGIKQTGISIRSIAAQLHLSEPLLRHLLQALQAPACDQDLAREGKISTNELVRRAKAFLRPAKHDETLTIDRDREIRIAADMICDWLLQTQLNRPAREAIVKEVQHKFLAMKEAGFHPSVAPHSDTPASKIIERAKPPALTDDSIDIVAWFAQWLCTWSFFAFPDEDIRETALDLARQMQAGDKTPVGANGRGICILVPIHSGARE